MISYSNSLSRGSGMPIQVRGVLVHAMSGTELSRVRTEFRLRLPEPINKSPLESRGPTLLCNHVGFAQTHLSGFATTQDLAHRSQSRSQATTSFSNIYSASYNKSNPAEFCLRGRFISDSEGIGPRDRRAARLKRMASNPGAAPHPNSCTRE